MADNSATIALIEGKHISSAQFSRQGESLINECIVIGRGKKDFNETPTAVVRQSSEYMLVQRVLTMSDVEDMATLESAGREALSEPREVIDVTINGKIDWGLLFDNDYVNVDSGSLDFEGLSSGNRVLHKTNYFTNPRMQVNITDGWTTSGAPTVTRDTSRAPFGFAASMKIVAAGVAGVVYKAISNTAATLVTVSFYAYKDGTAVLAADVDILINGNLIQGDDGGSLTITDVGLTHGKGWYRVSASKSAAGASTAHGVSVPAGTTLYVTGFQSENGALSDYFDGAKLGSGYAWSGTADNSTSTYSVAEGLRMLIRGRSPMETQGLMRLIGEVA